MYLLLFNNNKTARYNDKLTLAYITFINKNKWDEAWHRIHAVLYTD